MYKIIRVDTDNHGKKETLVACFEEADNAEKFLDKEFRAFKEEVFQSYINLRKEVKKGINEKLAVVETCDDISVDYKIQERSILWHFAAREIGCVRLEYSHYAGGMRYSTAYEAVVVE